MITPSQRDVMNALLRTDFLAFFMKAFATLVPGQEYEHNWHVDAIIHHLMMLHRGETRRLIINLPPRYLKSTLATVAFPAFLHGLDPTLRFICASYSSDLANYPELRSKAQALAMQYTPTKVLIEDSGTGIALIEDLKNHVGGVIGVKPIGDKASRMSAASALFEAGQVHFPAKAEWLDDLKAELLAFPGGKHDDQVDSISQALNHMKSDSSHLWAQIGDGFQQLTERLNRSRLEEMYGRY